jgi:dTDP-4-dehydrorhamnose reductase
MELAEQIVESVIAKVPFGIYHATNSGQGSWCDFAREVFELSGVSASRVVPIPSREFVRPAQRPAYSVLGHDGWKEIAPMRDWRVALGEAMPAIVEAVREDLARG